MQSSTWMQRTPGPSGLTLMSLRLKSCNSTPLHPPFPALLPPALTPKQVSRHWKYTTCWRSLQKLMVLFAQLFVPPPLLSEFCLSCVQVWGTAGHITCSLEKTQQRPPKPTSHSVQTRENTLLQSTEVLSITSERKETTRHKPDTNTAQQTCYHYDAGSLGIENSHFLSAILILFHPWVLRKINTTCYIKQIKEPGK